MRNKVLSSFIILLLFSNIPFQSNQALAFSKSVSARGAILMEQESGRVLFEKEAHTSMRIASITKIMTAILAIESGQLEEWVTVSSRAAGTEGSSIYLQEGEQIKLKDLVYGLMLRSGNDAAVAIAEHVAGSLEGFVYMMNEKREELGMTKSAFANPHGLDDHEEHYSSAYDMALLTRYAMENDVYREITATKSYRSINKNDYPRVFNNKNRLLTQLYKHSTGGKTGYTKRAKRTLVSTAENNDMNLIAVTINAPSDWNDHIHLFEWAFDSFEVTNVVQEGKLKDLENEYYKNKVTAEYSFEYPLAKEEIDNLNTRVLLYRPPSDDRWEREGHPYPVGTIQIELEDKVIGTVPLKYVEEVEKEESFWEKWIRQLFMAAGVKTSG